MQVETGRRRSFLQRKISGFFAPEFERYADGYIEGIYLEQFFAAKNPGIFCCSEFVGDMQMEICRMDILRGYIYLELLIFGGFPARHFCVLEGKGKSHLEMDEDRGYPYDSGNLLK